MRRLPVLPGGRHGWAGLETRHVVRRGAYASTAVGQRPQTARRAWSTRAMVVGSTVPRCHRSVQSAAPRVLAVQPAEQEGRGKSVTRAIGVHHRGWGRDRRNVRQLAVGQHMGSPAPAVATTIRARPRAAISRIVRSGSARAVADTKTMSAASAKGSW